MLAENSRLRRRCRPQSRLPSSGHLFHARRRRQRRRRRRTTFLARYYNRSYEAIANSMLCVTGTWDEVIDWIEKYLDAGATTVVLRLAALDQLRTLEECAEALNRRGLLG